MHSFSEIERYHIIEKIGIGNEGQKIIIIVGHKIPKSNIDYHLILQFIIHVLHLYSDDGIYLIYFHSDVKMELTSVRGWMKTLIDSLNANLIRTIQIRKTFIVHPTFVLKTLWSTLAPILKINFGNNFVFVNTLQELKQQLPWIEITFHLSLNILQYDKMVTEKCKSNLEARNKFSLLKEPWDVLSRRPIRNHALILFWPIKLCIDYLSNPAMLSMSDLFLPHPYDPALCNQLLKTLRDNIHVDFEDYNDPHLVWSVLTNYLQKMEEPLFTFDLYEEITAFTRLRENSKLQVSKIIMIYRLPRENYDILMILLAFLLKILQFRSSNQMTPLTMAKLFAPLLLRPRQFIENTVVMAVEMYSAAGFLTYLLEHFLEIF